MGWEVGRSWGAVIRKYYVWGSFLNKSRKKQMGIMCKRVSSRTKILSEASISDHEAP